MKPKIFISSTIYDFKDLRSALKFYFEKYGYSVQLSEFNDFSKTLDVNSYQACLDAIIECDFFILLIGARIGGYYDHGNQISICRKEYQTAYENAKGGKPKLLVFVRDEIWKIKEDRKELEKFLREDFATRKELTNEDLEKISHHPSTFINDAKSIFEFVDEVCRKNEMKAAVTAKGEFPKNNWVHSFANFSEIIDAVNTEFKLNLPIEELALEHNLISELVANIKSLLSKENNKITKSNDWAYFSRKHISKNLKTPTEMPYKYFVWLSIFAAVGNSKRNFLSTYFIEKAIGSGFYLQYNNQSDAYEETEFSKYLAILLKDILSLKSLEESTATNLRNFLEKYIHLKGSQEETIVSIETIDILPYFVLYDCHEDILNISKGLYQYLKGDKSALNKITRSPISPVEDIATQLKNERPTLEETITWIEEVK